MGFIDWFLLLLLAVLVFTGARRGLAGALVQFGGIVLSFFLIGHYYPLLANQMMLKYGFSKLLASFIAVILIVVLLVVIVRFVTWIFDRFIKAVGLTGVNRFLGGFLGLLNGLILIIVMMTIMDYIPKFSNKLKDAERHKVYAGIDLFKDEIFAQMQLQNHLQYIKMPKAIEKKEQ